MPSQRLFGNQESPEVGVQAGTPSLETDEEEARSRWVCLFPVPGSLTTCGAGGGVGSRAAGFFPGSLEALGGDGEMG